MNLWVFKQLMHGAKKGQTDYKDLTDRIDKILDQHAKDQPDLLEIVNRLKLEIRLITKGTPTTDPLDSIASQPLLRSDPNFNEQQYNAFSIVLKQAYRKVVMLAHPDRGGDKDVFFEVEQAYTQRDLARLTYIFIQLSASRNLYWQQSKEGISYASTEFDRPKIKLELLRNNPVFEIARYHMAGAPWRAASLMRVHLQNEIGNLSRELQFLRDQQNENSNQDSSEDSCQVKDSSACEENKDGAN